MDNMDIKLLLGKRIKELRKERGITQQQLAELINIDQRNMSAIECGLNFPTKHFVKIAKALKIELKELFNFNHLSLTEDEIRKESKQFIDTLSPHDLKIIYKLLASMAL